MATADVEITDLKVEGEGFCAGGDHPNPPIDAYPLLAWSHAHPVFGRMVVHLEDQKASVHDIAVAFAETPSLDAVAARFGTTPEHAGQAVRYAEATGYLAR